MRCTIKAKCSKQEFLKYARNSIKYVYKAGYTYGFYDFKGKADRDKYNLNFGKIENEIFKGWKLNGTNLRKIDTI